MPDYLLECKSCHYKIIFTASVDHRDSFKEECCGQRMRRIIAPIAAIIFKGGGWVGKDIKIDKWVNHVEEVCSEPACPSEIKEGQAMIAERQKIKDQQRISRGTHKLGLDNPNTADNLIKKLNP